MVSSIKFMCYLLSRMSPEQQTLPLVPEMTLVLRHTGSYGNYCQTGHSVGLHPGLISLAQCPTHTVYSVLTTTDNEAFLKMEHLFR